MFQSLNQINNIYLFAESPTQGKYVEARTKK